MIFLQPFFLLLLPAALIPLILALVFRLNRKTFDFPSLQILEEVLKRENISQRFTMKIKHLLRMLAIIAMVLAFSQPEFRGTERSRETLVILDPSWSMKDTPWKDAIREIRNSRKVSAVYFGETPYREDDPRWIIRNRPFAFTAQAAFSRMGLAENKDFDLVFITDGDSSDWKETVQTPECFGKIELIRLSRKPPLKPAVSGMILFPPFVTEGYAGEFTVTGSLNGYHGNGVLRLLLDGSEIYRGPLKFPLTVAHTIALNDTRKKTISGSVELEMGDGGLPFFFAMPVIRKPLILDRSEVPLAWNILLTLLPAGSRTPDPKFADIAVSTSMEKSIREAPVLSFCDDPSRITTELLAMTKGSGLRWEKKSVKGRPVSTDFPVLESIRDLELDLNCTLDSRFDAQAVVRLGGRPICYRFDNHYFFPFSLRENSGNLESSAFLLLITSEILTREWISKRLITEPEAGKAYLDTGGLPTDPDTSAGIFYEKGSGRLLVNNRSDGFAFRALPLEALAAKIKARSGATVKAMDFTPTKSPSKTAEPNDFLSFSLALLSILLLLLSVPALRASKSG